MVAVIANGSLLVATPTIVDPNFIRTVILICRHDDDGALGVVLNRPSSTPVGAFLPAWENKAKDPALIGYGGPVEPEAAIAVGAGDVSDDMWTPIVPGIGLVDLHLDPGDLPGLEWVRVFAGYAGWGPGQLDDEIDDAGWFVIDREPGDESNFELDWSAVLRRQPSDVALFADFPPDPTLN
jgi:putative transcriptional regulator